jgi:hypothetical protein
LHELYLQQAGMVGELEPALLESCLKLNDALLRTLTAERTHTQLEVEKLDIDLPPTPKGSSTPKNTASKNLLDFSPDATASTAGYTKSKLGNSSGFAPAPPAFAIADSFDDETSGLSLSHKVADRQATSAAQQGSPNKYGTRGSFDVTRGVTTTAPANAGPFDQVCIAADAQ